MQPTNSAKWPEEKDGFGVVVMEEAGGGAEMRDVVESTSFTYDKTNLRKGGPKPWEMLSVRCL
jgi:hypothetical protein